MLKSLLRYFSVHHQAKKLHKPLLACATREDKEYVFSSQLKSLEGEGGLACPKGAEGTAVRRVDEPYGCREQRWEGETFSKVSPSPRKNTHPTSKQIIGQQGEDAAAELVQRLGMKILARNWRKGRLELDIICQDGNTIVFVEVKTRKHNGMQSPFDALTLQKQRTLIRAAQAWLADHDAWHFPYRFDLIGVLHNGTTFTTEHMPHVFDLSSALGRSHTTWQPW